MTPQELANLAETFMNAYVLGTPFDSSEALPNRRSAGIRRRFPAVLSVPPEYEPLPNGFHDSLFSVGQGPEAFSGAPLHRYLDRCPLERTLVSSDDPAHLEFIFVVRYPPGQFDPAITEFVCLPSGDECHAVVSECLNRFRDFLGTDGELVGDAQNVSLTLSTSLQILTHDEFLALNLPDVLPK